MLLILAVTALHASASQALVLPHAKPHFSPKVIQTTEGHLERRDGAFAYLNTHQASVNSITERQFTGTDQAPVFNPMQPHTTVVVPDIPVLTATVAEGEVQSAAASTTFEGDTIGTIVTDIGQEHEPTEQVIITDEIASPTSLIEATEGDLPTSTMVHLPALASADIFADPIDTKPPPANVPQRDDHPVQRNGVLKMGPIGTNKFYANFFLDDQTTPCYSHPYVISWSGGKGVAGSYGMAISHTEANQRVWGPVTYNNANSYYINPVGIQSIIISENSLQNNTWLTTSSLTAFSATVHLRADYSSAPAISFPIVQGMGFVTASFYGGTPIFDSSVFFKSLTKVDTQPKPGVNKFVVELHDGQRWYIYSVSSAGLPLDIEFVSERRLQATSGFHGYIQVSKETGLNGTTGWAEDVYDQAVGAFPARLRLEGGVHGEVGRYSFGWIKGGLQSSKLLMWALPHHVDSFDGPTAENITPLRIQTTTKGMATAVHSDSWTMIEFKMPTSMGFAPWDPERGSMGIPSGVNETVHSMALLEMSQDMEAQSNLDSMYFSGKALAKFASIVFTMSELVGDRPLAAAGLARLKIAFARFANNTQEHPLVYEKAWGGVVSSASYTTGSPHMDFGNTYYNDHHFHYGYHILAAAIIGHLDPNWVEPNKDYVNMLIRDIANPSSSDEWFPEWRSFDWYHGHSWAHGLYSSLDGKNQESSSEDAMAAYAMKMWGSVTGDGNLEARSNLQLAVLARSLNHYYLYDEDNTSQPSKLIGNKVAGILFENKIDHTTFFGNNLEYIQGIHMIPLLPCSTLTRSKRLVREEWDAFFSDGRVDEVDSGWRGVLMGNLATIDPIRSYRFFNDEGLQAQWIDGGASRTWYLAFSAALAGGLPFKGGLTEQTK